MPTARASAFPRALGPPSLRAGGRAGGRGHLLPALNDRALRPATESNAEQEAHRLGKLLGVPVPDRHSVHVRGVSLHQFMGWGASTERCCVCHSISRTPGLCHRVRVCWSVIDATDVTLAYAHEVAQSSFVLVRCGQTSRSCHLARAHTHASVRSFWVVGRKSSGS